MLETKRIVIADALPIFRDALRKLLSSNPTFKVVGEATDARQAIRLARSHKPDLILLEPSMPSETGIDVIGQIKNHSPSTKIVILSVHKTEEHILKALKAGVHGYMLKNTTAREMMIALDNIFLDRAYLSPAISKKIIEGYLEGRKYPKSSTSWDSLTQRERGVFKMIAEGYRNKDIADYLCISSKTVEKHRANLMKKLDLHSASSVTAFAFEKGVISARDL
jgi:DNA-binding NarL/FixJ family response regulator